jgi:hypothetical protein
MKMLVSCFNHSNVQELCISDAKTKRNSCSRGSCNKIPQSAILRFVKQNVWIMEGDKLKFRHRSDTQLIQDYITCDCKYEDIYYNLSP